ncbi:unnamed protein product [Strongylus vulgaris]|uniref:Uncharacterized protein n=1 Tax=Strongylus vulgaris TaxID=40348 RepID=A0A3P7KNL8_STRVU|nr:unnamed protein product [Strongylus vulgaris]
MYITDALTNSSTASHHSVPVGLPSTSAPTATATTAVTNNGGRRLEPGEIPVTKSSVNKTLNSMNKSMLDAAMLQLLATQMMTQQAAVAKLNG